jgi:hypothetical protein
MTFFFNLRYHEFLLWLTEVGAMSEEDEARAEGAKPQSQDLGKLTTGWAGQG